MNILDIFDTGNAKALDRITVVTDEYYPSSGYYLMLGTDERGIGFSQFTEGQYYPKGLNKHLGRRVKLSALEPELQAHIKERLA